MTVDSLLITLRARLAVVQRLLDDVALLPHSLYTAGQLIELRGEQQFLAELIERQ